MLYLWLISHSLFDMAKGLYLEFGRWEKVEIWYADKANDDLWPCKVSAKLEHVLVAYSIVLSIIFLTFQILMNMNVIVTSEHYAQLPWQLHSLLLSIIIGTSSFSKTNASFKMLLDTVSRTRLRQRWVKVSQGFGFRVCVRIGLGLVQG